MAVSHGLYKLRKRAKKKRIGKFQRFIDKLIYLVAFIGPITALPQLLKIWINQDASGVSFLSWGLFLIFSLVWFFYAFLHKDNPLLFNSALWVIFELLILVGIFVYG